MELWIGALNLGLLYAFLAIGALITFRVLNFSDITVDGSFTTGAAVAAIMVMNGSNPIIALLLAFLAGTIAGSLTGIIYTKFKIDGILAGILVMVGLYSINLHIMGKSNVPLLSQASIFTMMNKFNPGMHQEIWVAVCLFVVILLFWLLISLFFKTDLGVTFRAAGNNPEMTSASGVNVQMMNIFGIALANGFVGLSGGLVAQYQGFADIGMGIGTLIISLASIIIGETILRGRSVFIIVLGAIIGSIIYRYMIAFALYIGMNPIDLKLLTAGFVLLTLVLSKAFSKGRNFNISKISTVKFSNAKKRKYAIAGAALLIILFSIFGSGKGWFSFFHTGTKYRIGVVQFIENGLLNTTRDALVDELKSLGYVDGDNITIDLKSANGDMSTVNTILDKFVMDKYDVIVTISTQATQAALNKVKNIPIVFATVANPFIIGAGTNDNNHQPNITGVYGWVPMDSCLNIIQQILPGQIKIGTMWDPSGANAVFNVEQLKKALVNFPNISFEGTTITGSTEVLNAAQSLADKKINAFVLPLDNVVYASFESIIKVADACRIPVFVCDLDKFDKNTVFAYGYNYVSSGKQAAGLVKRILNREKASNIPFERYKQLEMGLNFKKADDLGIKFPNNILPLANRVAAIDPIKTDKKYKIGIVQFGYEPNVEICKRGILMALKVNGIVDGTNIAIDYKNANGDFSMINSIMQDLLRQGTDIIVPLSTPVVQAAVQQAMGKETKVVFTYIYDPYRIGAAKTPSDHVPNMTGVACFPPIEKMLDLIKEMFPDRKKVGIVWNSSEANSESVLSKIRPYAKSIGLEIIEATVTSSAEVQEASKSLVSKGANIFLNPGDNTLNVSFDTFAKTADDAGIPVFSTDAEFVETGAIAALGPSYFQTGYEGGEYIARVIKGEKTENINISQTNETVLYLNLDIARKQGFTINENIIKRAGKVIDKSAKSQFEVNQANSGDKKIALFLFSDNLLLQTSARGVMDELKESGILNKYQIKIDVKNAQNDFANARSVAENICSENYNWVITLSTQSLQAMAGTNKTIPHVFGTVTDPYRLGVAKSQNDHQQNLTGVATFQPVETAIQTMREIFPLARTIGIVWNPAEVCSEACMEKARIAAKKYGFQLEEATVASTADVDQAIESLLDKKPDIFFTSGDNTVILALQSIAAKMIKYKIPYFTNTFSDVESGAFVSIGADYYEVGRRTGKVAERVINGENPKDIPIDNFIPEKMYLNMKLAHEYGIQIPENVRKRAAKTLE